MTSKAITELVRRRRAVFPPMYKDQPIDREIIEEILENANWAPTHKLTEPWRFRVFTGESLERLAQFMADFYREHTPEEQFSVKKFEKTLSKARRSACVIAICMQRDPAERVPEWEEIAAVACAVQNMWLTATAHGIGAYWSTSKSIYATQDLLDLQPGEQCLGYFFMGYQDGPELPGKRQPIDEKIRWM